MTDRAINFQNIVASIRDSADGVDNETNAPSATIATATGTGVVETCKELFSALEDAPDRQSCEFYMSIHTRRELERGLVETGPAAASMDFLDRQIRTDVSMPDETVLFMQPDAVTLGGTITGQSTIGVGTISSERTE
ncbi:hypothetical protein [Natronorubrum daqingense]|uniref:Uncharacterized protein n=1 Tax=Natronorubrum daqingense TaxID=588898 RepID=A0A1N7E1F9_9EURY|nr:hypothetical protein [Natronorubrum daqingense]APX96294.1 hypothetical protein BB347_06490 [Natronorubrum daqingense]SIR81785.1 hypothetical protein SAMN05421809_2384 [Natronorubrum daqingense]